MKQALYLTSKEAKKELKVQDCELAHIRNSGKLKFTKKSNSYLYFKESIEEFITKHKLQKKVT
jgi:hypothetical protein